MANYEPQLQRPKPASQWNLPVAVVNDGTGLGGLIAKIFGQDAQCLDQRFAVGHPKAITVKVVEHPLVRVEAVAVSQLQTLVNVTNLGAERGRARHGCVNMQPDILLPAGASNFLDRVNRVGGSSPYCGTNKKRNQPSAEIVCDVAGEEIGAHGEVAIHVDEVQVVKTDPGD